MLAEENGPADCFHRRGLRADDVHAFGVILHRFNTIRHFIKNIFLLSNQKTTSFDRNLSFFTYYRSLSKFTVRQRVNN